jgi:hypothetical protein
MAETHGMNCAIDGAGFVSSKDMKMTVWAKKDPTTKNWIFLLALI